MKKCEEKVMKYLSKRYHKYIVWAEKCHNSCDNSNVYFLTIKIKGKEYNAEPSDTIEDLKWNFKELIRVVEEELNIKL